jgi:hypothetical protein
MPNIQKTLDALQPYVIGIRYLEGTALVDAVFKEGWTVLEDPNIKKVKGNEELNYFMFYSESPSIGLDELLGHVDKVIKANQEREKKHDLLREKVNELKELFKKNSLSRLTRLKFVFGEEDFVPKLDEFEVDDTLDDSPIVMQEPLVTEEPKVNNVPYLDGEGNPIDLTEEEKEILEEEARAERNRKALTTKKNTQASKIASKIDLPPKKKIEMAIANDDYDSDCDCGLEEACSKCIDKKGL